MLCLGSFFFKIGIQGSHCNAITVVRNMLDVENGNAHE